MTRVTSKLQVSIPKALADQLGIRPGDDVTWEPAGDALRMRPPSAPATKGLPLLERLRLFDAATARQAEREHGAERLPAAAERGWLREDLYTR